jgi:hypothetical protein
MESWSLFLPLLFGAIAYGVLSVVAGLTASRGNDANAERVRDVAFLLLLAMGAWTVVLFLISVFDRPDDIGDMFIITFVIVAFFALLLLVLFGLSVVIGAAGRLMSRRRRVTTDEL